MKFKYLNTNAIEIDKLIEYANNQAHERFENERYVLLSSETLLPLTMKYSDDKLLPHLFEDPQIHFGNIIHTFEGKLYYIEQNEFRKMVFADMENNWQDVWEYVMSDLLFDMELCLCKEHQSGQKQT